MIEENAFPSAPVAVTIAPETEASSGPETRPRTAVPSSSTYLLKKA